MNQRNENVIIITTFTLGLVGLICINIFFAKHIGKKGVSPSFQVKDMVAGSIKTLHAKKAKAAVSTTRQDFVSQWGRDPFESKWVKKSVADETAPQESAGNDELVLTAIIIGDTTRSAAISGKILSEGDMIGGQKVIAIRKDGVVMEKNGIQKTLHVKKSTVHLKITQQNHEGE